MAKQPKNNGDKQLVTDAIVQESQMDKKLLMRNRTTLMHGLNSLRDPNSFGSPAINGLIDDFLHLLSAGKISLAFTDEWNESGWWASTKSGRNVGTIVLPSNFHEMVTYDPIFHFCIVVKFASIARDAAMRKNADEDWIKRHEALESEYIKTYQHRICWWLPSGYHIALRYKYPDGISSLDQSLVYWK